jgi:hypothetical protein
MSEKYKIREKEKAYFNTSTLVGWRLCKSRRVVGCACFGS